MLRVGQKLQNGTSKNREFIEEQTSRYIKLHVENME